MLTSAVEVDNAVPPVAAEYHFNAVPVADKLAIVFELNAQNV